jgi:hypothetical protein
MHGLKDFIFFFWVLHLGLWIMKCRPIFIFLPVELQLFWNHLLKRLSFLYCILGASVEIPWWAGVELFLDSILLHHLNVLITVAL